MAAMSPDVVCGMMHSLMRVLNLPRETQRIVIVVEPNAAPKVHVVTTVPINTFGGLTEAIKNAVVEWDGSVTITRFDGEQRG